MGFDWQYITSSYLVYPFVQQGEWFFDLLLSLSRFCRRRAFEGALFGMIPMLMTR